MKCYNENCNRNNNIIKWLVHPTLMSTVVWPSGGGRWREGGGWWSWRGWLDGATRLPLRWRGHQGRGGGRSWFNLTLSLMLFDITFYTVTCCSCSSYWHCSFVSWVSTQTPVVIEIDFKPYAWWCRFLHRYLLTVVLLIDTYNYALWYRFLHQYLLLSNWHRVLWWKYVHTCRNQTK